MKKLILLPILTFFCISSFGQLKSAKVFDPQNWSQYVDDAYFSSAKINVKPQGAFANVEMEFEIGNNENLFVGTQYEIEYLFKLPEGSIIHEAYLWMFGIQVKAKLYEKSEAKMIYESYVNRRTDPLIIYKTGNNYEARIYPLTTDEPRRFKISVLMPMELKNGKPTYELPLDLFARNADLENDMIVTIDHTTDWGNIENTNGLTLDSYDETSTSYRVSKTADLNQIPKLSFENEIGDQLYVEYTGTDKGYFQVIMEDTLKIEDPAPQKYVFVLDITSKYSTINHRDFADLLKHHILENLNPADEFNVVYGQNNLILMGSTTWSRTDSASVNQLFNNIKLNQQPKESNTIKLVEFALERIVKKTNDQINLTIFSASNKVHQTTSALNASINQLTQLNEGNCTINALEFYNVAEFTNWELWNFPELYINNAYFFYNLCIKNQGNYTTMVDPTNYWIRNTSVTSEDLMAQFFQSFGKNKTFVDYKYSADGILYHTVQPQRSKNLKLNSNFIITGEFINGIDDLSIDYFYQYNDNILSKNVEFTPTEVQNSLTKKIWAGTYYNQQVSSNNTLAEKREIINKSLEIEFLTDYTSFLALEPDTIEINAEEIDLVDVYEKKAPADIEVIAYPNPCNTYIVLETSLTTELKNQDYTITLSDLSGKTVETIYGNTMWDDKLKVRIDFTDNNLEAGIYFATVQIGLTKKTIRIVKY